MSESEMCQCETLHYVDDDSLRHSLQQKKNFRTLWGDEISMDEKHISERPDRREFVERWLDAHVHLFPPPPREPKLITRLGSRTFGPSEVHYYYSDPITVPTSITTPHKLPYILKAPYRISPLRPMYVEPSKRTKG